jgi:hypothetical protein
MMKTMMPSGGDGARNEPDIEFGICLSAISAFVSITHVPCGRWVHNVSILNIATMMMGHHCDNQGDVRTRSW